LHLLLYCIAAFALGVPAALIGASWMLQGGTFRSYDSTHPGNRSNFMAGLGSVGFGIVSTWVGVLMARDVEPRLWGIAVAMAGPLPGLRAALKIIYSNWISPRIPDLLDSVRLRLGEGHAPTVIVTHGTSPAHEVVRSALRVERPAKQIETGSYRSAEGRQDDEYLAQVRASIERTRRQILRRLALWLLPGAAPFFAILFYAIDSTPLEALGWQVLCASCALGIAGGAFWLWVRAQTMRAGKGVLALLVARS